MRDQVFAMELRGRAAPVEGRESTLQAQTAGRGPSGETVHFASEVVLKGETFTETGRINYMGRGSVTFDTVGVGHIGPSPLPDTQWGAVIWRITAGDGEFRGATISPPTSRCRPRVRWWITTTSGWYCRSWVPTHRLHGLREVLSGLA